LTGDVPKEDLVFHAILNGILVGGPLMGDLAQRTPPSLSKFMYKIEEYINAEETMKALLESKKSSLDKILRKVKGQPRRREENPD
jgi:hypothetical protein